MSVQESARASLAFPILGERDQLWNHHSRFTWGHESQGVRCHALHSQPLCLLQLVRTRVPGRGDSPLSPGVAMVRARRAGNRDCPAAGAALASALAYSVAGLIPSQLSSVWTCPPQPAAAASSPIPRQRLPGLPGAAP